MDKLLCFGVLGVGALMLVVFLLDLVAGIPFGGGVSKNNPFALADILGLLGSAVVVYLGWNSLRDLK